MKLREGELGASKLIGAIKLVNWPELACGSGSVRIEVRERKF